MFEELKHLFLYENIDFDEKYTKPYLSLCKNIKEIPWHLCIPTEHYNQVLKNIEDCKKDFLNDSNKQNYMKLFREQDIIFNSLQPGRVNVSKYENIRKEDGNKITYSFDPIDENGLLRSIVYNRLGSITGRLTISSGPEILHLKKEYRKSILESSFDGGSIYSLDFVSLEARLAFLLTDKELPGKDIYQFVIDETKLNINREQAKIAVLSLIFGSQNVEGINENQKEIIEDVLGIPQLKKRLIEEFETNDRKYIKNLYGRHVSTREAKPYMLVNYFIQSTAVDIALLGFSKMIQYLKENELLNYIKPLFVLVDAIIFDVHPNYKKYMPTLCKIASMDIPHFEYKNFYVREEVLAQDKLRVVQPLT